MAIGYSNKYICNLWIPDSLYSTRCIQASVFINTMCSRVIGTVQVKDLEVELETTKQKNKENLQQAILIERERFTQMQWDMEELRRKSLEMEMKFKSESV